MGDNTTPQTVSEEKKDYIVKEHKDRFLKKMTGEIEPEISSVHEAVRAGFERLRVNEGYMRDLETVKKLVRENADRYFDAIVNRLGKEQFIREQTHSKCTELDEFIYHTQKLIASVKMRETPYSKTNTKQNFLEHNELLVLANYFEQMEKIDTDELVDMVFEDQHFIAMLSELREHPDTHYDPQQPEFKHLVDFVLGSQEEYGTERSEFRQQAEQLLWQELVHSMTFDNKADLVTEVIRRKGKEAGRKFIASAILVGAMTRREMRYMLQEHFEEAESSRPLTQQLGTPEEMEQFLRDSVEAKAQLGEDIQDYVDQQRSPPFQNAANELFTFNKLAGETIARCGALTCIVNGVLIVSSALNKRQEAGWSRPQAFAIGVGEALKNKYVLGGAAVAAAASNIIWPWWKNVVYSPGSAEQEQLWNSQEENFLREQAEDHEEIIDVFVDIYENLFNRAKLNQNNGPIDEKGEHVAKGERDPSKRTFDLWLHDVQITPEQAGQAGYPSVDMAKAVIIRMFNFIAKKEKKTTQEQVIDFLDEKKRKLWRINEHEAHKGN